MNDAKARLIRAQERAATLEMVARSWRKMSLWRRFRLVFLARWI